MIESLIERESGVLFVILLVRIGIRVGHLVQHGPEVLGLLHHRAGLVRRVIFYFEKRIHFKHSFKNRPVEECSNIYFNKSILNFDCHSNVVLGRKILTSLTSFLYSVLWILKPPFEHSLSGGCCICDWVVILKLDFSLLKL